MSVVMVDRHEPIRVRGRGEDVLLPHMSIEEGGGE